MADLDSSRTDKVSLPTGIHGHIICLHPASFQEHGPKLISSNPQNNLVDCVSGSDHPMEICARTEGSLLLPDLAEEGNSSASREVVEQTEVTNEKGESDITWMSQGFDYEADDREARMNVARMKTLRANITRKRKQNKPCVQDEVDLAKAKIEMEGYERRSRGRKQM